MIRVILPSHLRALARIDGEVRLDVVGPVTQRSVLDELEARYPALRGTIRAHDGGPRRAFIRFFACEQDLSHEPPDAPLPEPVAGGTEPYLDRRGHGRRLMRCLRRLTAGACGRDHVGVPWIHDDCGC